MLHCLIFLPSLLGSPSSSIPSTTPWPSTKQQAGSPKHVPSVAVSDTPLSIVPNSKRRRGDKPRVTRGKVVAVDTSLDVYQSNEGQDSRPCGPPSIVYDLMHVVYKIFCSSDSLDLDSMSPLAAPISNLEQVDDAFQASLVLVVKRILDSGIQIEHAYR